jgi:hypothetical protein
LHQVLIPLLGRRLSDSSAKRLGICLLHLAQRATSQVIHDPAPRNAAASRVQAFPSAQSQAVAIHGRSGDIRQGFQGRRLVYWTEAMHAQVFQRP